MVAIAGARLTSVAIQVIRRRGGTTAPGLVAERIDPAILTKLVAHLSDGAVVVAGTNGKTTTSRLIAEVLTRDGRRVVHNRSGSNLLRGIIASLLTDSRRGRPDGDIAVIEADEAAFPEVVRQTRPRVVLLNNLFRDQLDRYGELDTILRAWRRALAELADDAVVVVNGDDAALAELTESVPQRRVVFGLDEERHRLTELPHAVDSTTCVCGAALEYEAVYVGHLGVWSCPVCGRARPALDVTGTDVELRGVDGLALTVAVDGGARRLETGLPGLYNAYNVLAAAAVLGVVGAGQAAVHAGLAAFQSAFGRAERVELRGRHLMLLLAKNPVGFNEILRMLTQDQGSLTAPTLIAINDRAADGRDVSWLWDVDFELLAPGAVPLFAAGVRGTDMGNRLKYAGVDVSRIHPLGSDPAAGLDGFVDALPEGGTGYVVSTYTAMLDLHRVLSDRGAVVPFWKQ